MNIAASDIIQKYCVLSYNRAIKRFRIYASVMKLRRPWDGEDGVLFADWMKKFSVKYSAETMKIEELDGECIYMTVLLLLLVMYFRLSVLVKLWGSLRDALGNHHLYTLYVALIALY